MKRPGTHSRPGLSAFLLYIDKIVIKLYISNTKWREKGAKVRSKFPIVITAILAVFFIFNTVNAHSGRTNSSGCHNDNINGGYHCHGGTSTPAPTPTYTPQVYKPTVTTKTELTTESIPFETMYETDENLEVGKEIVKQEGKEGVRTITFSVTYTDGKETARTKSDETVTTEPTPKIISKGTKKKEVVPENNNAEINTDAEVAGASDSEAFGGFLLFAAIGGGYYFYKKMRNKLEEKK